MDRRGMSRRSPQGAPKGKPEPAAAPAVGPERYAETLFQHLAEGIHTARVVAPWHFEARKFLLDLGRLPEVSRQAPRGA